MSEQQKKTRPDLQWLGDGIKQLVYQRVGEISVTEAIGAMEIAKLELLREQQS